MWTRLPNKTILQYFLHALFISLRACPLWSHSNYDHDLFLKSSSVQRVYSKKAWNSICCNFIFLEAMLQFLSRELNFSQRVFKFLSKLFLHIQRGSISFRSWTKSYQQVLENGQKLPWIILFCKRMKIFIKPAPKIVNHNSLQTFEQQNKKNFKLENMDKRS